MILTNLKKGDEEMIMFTIPGPPTGKARPRVTRWGTHTPEQTVLYENLVKTMYMQTRTEKFADDKMIEMSIEAYFKIPKSATKGKRLAMIHNIVRPIKKPDIDNICKIIADALNGLAYKDDTQIVKVNLEKFYSDDEGKVVVKLQEFDPVNF
ncbi:MAG: RusA family crossover junction endodeoxyribonuclease [Candidatus Magnetobacterium sp. LHC-1]